MTIRNPSFGVYPADDDHGGFGQEAIDPRVNVEKQMIGLSAEGVFKLLRNDRDMNCTVVIDQGDKKTVWQNPRGPCTTKNENLFSWLCDGRIPTCEGFHPGGQGYDPTGCRSFRKCSGRWTRTAVHKKKKARPGFCPG